MIPIEAHTIAYVSDTPRSVEVTSSLGRASHLFMVHWQKLQQDIMTLEQNLKILQKKYISSAQQVRDVWYLMRAAT